MAYAWKSSLAAAAVLRASTQAFAFLPPPLFTSPHSTTPGHLTALRQQYVARHSGQSGGAGMSSWSQTDKDLVSVTAKEKTVVVETKTLRVPLSTCLSPNEKGSEEDDTSRQICWEEHGLICLERVIPENVLRGLEILAEASSPFKTKVVRLGGRERAEEGGIVACVETLIAPLVPSIALSDQPSFQVPDELESVAQLCNTLDSVERQLPTSPHQQDVQSYGTDGIVSSTTEVAMSDKDVAEIVRLQARKACGVEAWCWLKEDIKVAATLFAEEGFRQATPQGASSVEGGAWFPFSVINGIADEAATPETVDVTVKLELLEKGKCPRLHLDKVSLRLICTYVGPSTEWVDGYDPREMEQNRSAPAACNEKISGGREARHASTGNLLIFRGQPPNAAADRRAVAHRSPDMSEGHRRLVLTIDMGDLST